MIAPRRTAIYFLLSTLCALASCCHAQCSRNRSTRPPLQAATPRDGQHDFDFEIGTWKIHLKRLRASFDRLDHLGGTGRHRRRPRALGWPREYG